MTCASSEQTNHNKCGLAIGGECQLFGNSVVADRSGRQLYRNTLTTDSALHNDNNISDAVQQNQFAGQSGYAIP